MYLHLGGDILIKKDIVVAIIDLEIAAEGKGNNKFLNNIKDNDKLVYISEPGKEKSLIITTENYFLSPISSTTLFKRSFSVLDE
ncbi:hypothetical protein Desaci_0005 [Desulfosporosinus acidiphilus SJ4]|uniref:DUF370 domain-containing protein n=1 Tax=Desulfosporosinus acidiphilus (strain DSM 22704 / JCM 16185 / SJ4) TaxID=646529 RepID=I4D002_DESAJ|nr:extracellular matrix/biofilm biosynthesis regulator RemA family protein [Desulfosporosinus acidiphilus]AFM39126.1 hypothetical protein Desaci_0005 [Desulfosporosinus acidiphilus SJ4]